MNDIIIHHKITDLYHTLNLPYSQDIDFTILSIPDIHPEIPFKSPRLRADYFSFIITKAGSGIYYLDDEKFPFSSGTIYFTNPGHLKSYELHECSESYIIVLSDNFLRENVHAEIYTEFPFLLAETVRPQKMSEPDFDEFSLLYRQIFIAFNKESGYKNKILGNLFTVLLLKIKEKYWLNYNPIDEGNRNSEIVKSFKKLLDTEFRKVIDNDRNGNRLQVQYFAEQLHLHPNYLNSVIKSKTGRTVNDWISRYMITAAKNLLMSTSLSSKEIAYRLGFSEPTHFSRFFKKQLQLSPGIFRQENKS
jgi:AraC-like DNA-binding protein